MYEVVKKKVGKLPYGALITLIMRLKAIYLDDFKEEKLVNVEIGKKILKKMMLKMTPDC